ncbi:MAG: hypothetical protein Q8P95_03855 [bacterium]|nr:hypothetical protein [bacterium]
MKKILLSFCCLMALLVGGVGVFAAYANQVSTPEYVLPAFTSFYSQGYAEGIPPYFINLQPLLVDINGDGLLDMIFSANTINYHVYPNIVTYPASWSYFAMYNPAYVANTLWRQEIRLNTGNGFRLVSKCEYTTPEEYATNCQ